jgi:hypothetical protein
LRRGAQEIDQVLGVAQIGEVGRGDDEDVVGGDQHALRPSAPHMRHVDDGARDGGAQHVEDAVEGLGGEVVDALQRRRRRQQAQMIGALR